MLLAEKSILFHRGNHPLSPTLAKAILDVQLWKTTISIVLNKQLRKKAIDNIINRMIHYNHSPDNIHCANIKLIPKYLRESKNHLTGIKREATNYREVHLTQLVDKEFILGKIKHARYLRNLITIEQQVALHKKIQSFKKVNDKSRLKEIVIPKNKTLN